MNIRVRRYREGDLAEVAELFYETVHSVNAADYTEEQLSAWTGERGVWEICKLATDRAFRGRGAGRAVFESCMKYAVSRGAKKLTILSNRKLVPAIGLYLSCGFREVPAEDVGYERVDILLEKTICE